MHTRMRRILSVAFLCGIGMAAVHAIADDNYTDEIEAWRVEHEAQLEADDGWLTVSALFFLREGENSFGSSPRNDLTLPDGVPAEAGVFEVRHGTVTLHAPTGRTLRVPHARVSAGLRKTDQLGGNDRVALRARDDVTPTRQGRREVDPCTEQPRHVHDLDLLPTMRRPGRVLQCVLRLGLAAGLAALDVRTRGHHVAPWHLVPMRTDT